MTYNALFSEGKAAMAWGVTLPEWVELPRWARKNMYAIYLKSMHIDAIVAEESMPDPGK